MLGGGDSAREGADDGGVAIGAAVVTKDGAAKDGRDDGGGDAFDELGRESLGQGHGADGGESERHKDAHGPPRRAGDK